MTRISLFPHFAGHVHLIARAIVNNNSNFDSEVLLPCIIITLCVLTLLYECIYSSYINILSQLLIKINNKDFIFFIHVTASTTRLLAHKKINTMVFLN